MRLGLRLLFGVFAILGLAAFFVLNVFVNEVRPSVAEVMEDVMIDSANMLAELASHDLAAGNIRNGDFARSLRAYNTRNPQAMVWGFKKQSVDFRVLVTDAQGVVQFDSENRSVDQDFSKWRDVLLTLRGRYGARTTSVTREEHPSGGTSIFNVAAPIVRDGKVIGVLSLAKATSTVAPFVERAERKILVDGAWLLGLSLLVGVAATLWIVAAVRRLTLYADEAEAGRRTPVPALPGELGKLAHSMAAMRARLEGQGYIENTVRALTHELKSPIAAIRGAGELLREPMSDKDRVRFANNVVAQSERMHSSVERMLELSKLEQRAAPEHQDRVAVVTLFKRAQAHTRAHAEGSGVTVQAEATAAELRGDAELLQLALDNLIHNAIDFSPQGATVHLAAKLVGGCAHIEVSDEGPGFADFVKERIGERFVSTPRPNGGPKGSGLGLAIALQVAELHGGSLRVDDGAGPTRVRLIVPLQAS
ncbi:MAG: two-component system sensor histidine kinase CreC [Betaproteobacteria bacterium]